MTRILRGFVTLLITLVVSVTATYAQDIAVVTRPNATLHGTPSDDGKVIAKLDRGTQLEILIARGTWHLVQSTDYVGWISNGAVNVYTPKTSDLLSMPPVIPPAQTQTTPVPLPSSAEIFRTVPSVPSRTYIRGPRGGCYYINSSGKKTYVDRSLCG